jgi:hypothetical protein
MQYYIKAKDKPGYNKIKFNITFKLPKYFENRFAK